MPVTVAFEGKFAVLKPPRLPLILPSMFSRYSSTFKIFIVGLAGSLIIRVLNRTLRWKYIGLDGEERFWTHGEPRILAFWHSQQLLMPWIYLNARKDKSCRKISVLISQHGDGRMVARAMKFLGIHSVAGSSSRRGREAMYNLIETIKNGDHIAITPDGPKGPACKLKPGVIRIAERSQAPIYPTAVAAERCWTFKSWDKMILPKPFSRMVMIMGEKIVIPQGLTEEEFQKQAQKVEDALNQLSSRANAHWNHV